MYDLLFWIGIVLVSPVAMYVATKIAALAWYRGKHLADEYQVEKENGEEKSTGRNGKPVC